MQETAQRDTWTIRSGDNPTSIARELYPDAPPDQIPDIAMQIMEANGILRPGQIQIGQTLIIPDRSLMVSLPIEAAYNRDVIRMEGRRNPASLGDPATSRDIILSGGRLGTISVGENPDADPDAPFYEARMASMVRGNEDSINESAAEYGVDPDLVRAIMFVETTHGWYDLPLRWLGREKSILPMNINTDYWGDEWGTREELRNPDLNIAGGTRMLGNIVASMPEASVAEIATIYNNSNAAEVSDYGARVEEVYRNRLWEPQEYEYRVPDPYLPPGR